jgi:hypothetical protein
MPGVDDDLAAALSAALAEPMPVTPPPMSVPEEPVQSLLREPAPQFAPPAAPPMFDAAPPVFEAARPFSAPPVAAVPAPVVPMPVIPAVTAQPAERGAWTTPVAPAAPAHVVSAPVEQPQARYWVPGDDDITPSRKR